MQGEDLARLVERLSAEPEMSYTLEQVVEEARLNVPGCESCAVCLRSRNQVEHSTATDLLSEQLDRQQVVLGEGPLFDVSWDHELVRCDDLSTERRWPRWVAEARRVGMGSSLTLLLPVQGRSATLSMYSRETNAFDQTSWDLAVVYARLSGVAVQQAHHAVGLRTALQSRLLIGVAQGILMNHYGLSLDRAFEVLRRRSNETNTKLRDVALALVREIDGHAFAPEGGAVPAVDIVPALDHPLDAPATQS